MNLSNSKQKKTPPTKGEISFAELKREDFVPVTRERIGKGLAKLAKAPKAGK